MQKPLVCRKFQVIFFTKRRSTAVIFKVPCNKWRKSKLSRLTRVALVHRRKKLEVISRSRGADLQIPTRVFALLKKRVEPWVWRLLDCCEQVKNFPAANNFDTGSFLRLFEKQFDSNAKSSAKMWEVIKLLLPINVRDDIFRKRGGRCFPWQKFTAPISKTSLAERFSKNLHENHKKVMASLYMESVEKSFPNFNTTIGSLGAMEQWFLSCRSWSTRLVMEVILVGQRSTVGSNKIILFPRFNFTQAKIIIVVLWENVGVTVWFSEAL